MLFRSGRWYDGYRTASGERLFNPRSVVCALANNQLANYWTSSGPNLVLLAAREGIEAGIHNYAAASMELNTKDEIYSAMVIYGLLTYTDGKVYIPNKERMDKFQDLRILLKRDGRMCRIRKGLEIQRSVYLTALQAVAQWKAGRRYEKRDVNAQSS